MSYESYHGMPFEELFNLVFTASGEVKNCGRAATRELIERLEDELCKRSPYNDIGAFGDADTGYLRLPDAYQAAQMHWDRMCHPENYTFSFVQKPDGGFEIHDLRDEEE